MIPDSNFYHRRIYRGVRGVEPPPPQMSAPTPPEKNPTPPPPPPPPEKIPTPPPPRLGVVLALKGGLRVVSEQKLY